MVEVLLGIIIFLLVLRFFEIIMGFAIIIIGIVLVAAVALLGLYNIPKDVLLIISMIAFVAIVITKSDNPPKWLVKITVVIHPLFAFVFLVNKFTIFPYAVNKEIFSLLGISFIVTTFLWIIWLLFWKPIADTKDIKRYEKEEKKFMKHVSKVYTYIGDNKYRKNGTDDIYRKMEKSS
jgi:membrane-bound ClpP family serine protease